MDSQGTSIDSAPNVPPESMIDSVEYPVGAIFHCNRCDGNFKADKPMRGGALNENRTAARLITFYLCPHCGMTDTHWVYARDWDRDLTLATLRKIEQKYG